MYIFLMHNYVEISVPMFPTFTILHPKQWVKYILKIPKCPTDEYSGST